MEDSDDNIGQLNLGEYERNDEDIVGSNVEQDNILLEKGRKTESSNYEGAISNRFTVVENNFSDEPSDIKDDSVNISKNSESKNNSKIEALKKKKKEKKTQKKTNIVNIKIILLGDVSVGKTSIVGRYINNYFDEFYKCTIQAEQQKKIIKEDEETSIKMNIWDTAGQEKFRSLTRQYYHDCDGAIIVFDLTKKESLDKIINWFEDIKNYGNDYTKIIILGNKSDLTGEREVSSDAIKDQLKKLNDDDDEDYSYYEVSAKNGNNISMAFDKIKKLIMEYRNKKEKKERENNNKEKKGKSKKDRNTKNNKEEIRTKSLNEFDKDLKEKNKKCC